MKNVVLTILFWLSLPLLLPCLLVSYSWRLLASKVFIKFVRNAGKILTTRSSLSGTDQMYTFPKYNLVVVSTFEGDLPLDAITSVLKTRILDPSEEYEQFLRPEFKQYVSHRFGFLFWQDELDFKIEDHIRLYDGQYKEQFKGQDLTPEMLLSVANEYTYKPFKNQTSPWEMLILYNYRESPILPLSTAIVTHIHHCLGDGFSLLNATVDTLERKIETPPIIHHRASPPRSSFSQSMFVPLRAPYDLITEILASMDVNAWHLPERKLKQTLNSALSPPIPISYVKEVKNLHKVSFTGVIMECFTASIRKFMAEAGLDVPKSVHCAVPLPMPQHPSKKMRNHLTACYVNLPVGENNASLRLAEIEKDLERVKNSTFPQALFWTMSLLGGIFTRINRHLVKNDRTTVLMSNFPGPMSELNFKGHKLTSVFFGGGLHKGRCGIGFSGISCTGYIRFVFALDEGLVSRNRLPASRLVEYFLEELDILKREAV